MKTLKNQMMNKVQSVNKKVNKFGKLEYFF